MNENSKTSNDIGSFFMLTFIITLPFYILCGLAANEIFFPQIMAIPFAISIVVAPIIAALILNSRKKGLDKKTGLVKKSFDFKISKKIWYIPTFLILPIVWILTLGLLILTGVTFDGLTFPLIFLVFLLPIFIIGSTCEEVGWQGYVYDKMEDRWHAFKASLILGVIWAFWHVPVWFFTIPADPQWVWLVGQILNLIGSRILIVWIYNNTEKRVFPAILIHVIFDVGSFMLPNFITSMGMMITGIVCLIIALLVVFLWGPETMTEFRKKK